jgi:hypothetical protein
MQSIGYSVVWLVPAPAPQDRSHFFVEIEGGMACTRARPCETARAMSPRWCLVVGLVLAATPARAASIDIRCPKLAESSKSELEARAQLLLSSARMASISVGIECDGALMWVIWVDGRRLQIDTSSGVVEGSLDAIEDLILMSRRPNQRKAEAPPDPPSDREGLPGVPDRPVESPGKPRPFAPLSPDVSKEQLRGGLQGGVVVSTLAEWWDSSMGIGPRFEVGVRVGGQFAFVLAEGARFGVGSSAQTLALDLQWGIAYGAPYASRTGVGLVLLGGAERVTAATAVGGWFAWRATGSLGLRASGAAGSVDLWAGPELIVRSGPTESLDAADSHIPQVSGMLSVGCLFPAFGAVQRDNPPALYAVEQ